MTAKKAEGEHRALSSKKVIDCEKDVFSRSSSVSLMTLQESVVLQITTNGLNIQICVFWKHICAIGIKKSIHKNQELSLLFKIIIREISGAMLLLLVCKFVKFCASPVFATAIRRTVSNMNICVQRDILVPVVNQD